MKFYNGSMRVPRGRVRPYRLLHVFGSFLARSRYMNFQGCDYQIRGMDLIGNVCEYRPAGYQVRKVEGGEAAWYASKNEAVGLGRDASPSSDDLLPSGIFFSPDPHLYW